ncbi:Zn(2)-C6 fungal-type domain-containing protein [Mycena venus]|uniref:Zn(2)-C6 fungal-type domain-containing protein n=1 Tax=Mycena venus TaxID=2733690 RepID=A0A8H6YFZ1_9AGAR|nr:Zn(2)-C6 fungal-type domain-containing protein [Mycena venus]
MSSSSDSHHDQPSTDQPAPQLRRSCDTCRRKKIRCEDELVIIDCGILDSLSFIPGDSATMPDGRCSSCIFLNTDCTHTYQLRVMKVKRGPKNRRIDELEKKLAVVEAKLNSVQSQSGGATPSTSLPPSHLTSPYSPWSLPEEEELTGDELAEYLSAGSWKHRFFGSASAYMLAKDAMAVKDEYVGRPIVAQFRRPEFWNIRPWEDGPPEENPRYVYPDPDLISSLTDLYFVNIHPMMPLLHRPSFERSARNGQHLQDHRFGATLLAVLAIASRYSDDPRVLVPGFNSAISSGWNFFNQVQLIRKSLFDEPSIYEVQLYCLMSVYTLGTSSPQAGWLYIGLGIRFIQERGMHRRQRDEHKITVEDELWKRAFWCLLYLERSVCVWLGRPTCLHVEDYDIELPLDVDDEYWEHSDPEQAFKQPPGKPALLAYFNCHIRLNEILGSTLRLMYGSNKSRALLGLVGAEWERRAITDLNSLMKEFRSSIPEHLRWDPNGSGVFFDQSAALHASYYKLQITIHRPYIHKPTILALPSLNMCTSAARSLIQVVDVWLQKTRRITLVHLHTGIFISGVILLLNLYGVKRAGLPIDEAKEMAHVDAAMRILKFHETRFQTAGRLWDMLQQLKSSNGPSPSGYVPIEPRAKQNVILTQQTQPAGAVPETTSSSIPPIADDELSPHSVYRPSQHPWNGMFSSTANSNSSTVPSLQAGMTIEQLLATTPDDNSAAAGLAEAQTMDQWSSMFSGPVSDLWYAAAPPIFGDIPDWDAYMESMNAAMGSGSGWTMTHDSDPRLAGLFPLPQHQSSSEGHYYVP